MVGLAVGAARRVPRRPRRARASIERARPRGRARAAPAIRRSSATRSATRSRRRSSRWHGRRRVERFLERLYRAAKDEDPDALVTYVNYPSTEYLELPFLDFVCFNVYLESRERARGVPRAAAEPRRRPAAADGRDRARQPPQRRGGAGRDARLAGPQRLRGGLRRRVRVRVDRRVAPRRRRRSTTGTSASPTASAQPEAGARRRRATRSPRCRSRAGSAVAARLGRRLHLQRRAHDRATACDGLRALDYPNYEVIVVDDGSTDARPRSPRRVRLPR